MSARPLTVLDITEYYGETSGGVRTYLREKSAFVARHADIRQIVVVPGERDCVSDVGRGRRYEIGVPFIPGQRPYRVMLAPGRVRAILERERPDIIEIGSSHFVPWLVRGAARRLGIPTVWFFHGHIPRVIAPRLEADAIHRRWAARVAARYVRRISRSVARTLVASDAVRADLERFGVERVVRVPLGVDTGTYHPSRRAHLEVTRRRFGIGGGPLAVYAGRLTAEKELATAIAGWKKVRHRDATLLLVGTGPQESRLRALSDRQIRIVPFVHDRDLLADLYAAADLYLAPGPAETFGLAAHEAMACGTPVLSVDVGAVAEQVRLSGAGALYRLGDPDSVAESADRLLDAAGSSRDAARRFIETHHRWDIAFARIFDVYRDVLG
ncbi:MAG TPA: glycosyltransferase [Gemmatimonadales bacterium]|nr:glycosyltransferase [Gemmatimonadales bacterium]